MAVLEQRPETVTVFDVYAPTCSSRQLLNLVTSRWAVLIVGALEDGPLRFGVLRRLLDGISPKVLTEKLRDLEGQRLVERSVTERPLAVDYRLTDVGRSLTVPLAQLRMWAQSHCDDI